MPGYVKGGGSSDPNHWVYEMMTSADWSKGPAGSGETRYSDLAGMSIESWKYVWPHLLESLETPALGVWVLNVRKGVHWALNPNSEASRLVGGRELTADDIEFSITFQRDTPTASLYINQPALARNATVERTGPWQLTLKTPVDPGVAYQWILGGSGVAFVWAKEVVVPRYKNNDWRDVVGTGPYMLTDVVPGSVLTLTRNPNYWQKNPAGPGKGDQLPYPNGVKILIVPDLSTRVAAMRTGKVDLLGAAEDTGLEWEDAQSLLNTNPKLMSVPYLGETRLVVMRLDKQNLPFSDKRVRQALMLATDFDAFKKDFYGGNAELLTWPVTPSPITQHIYTPVDKLPESAGSLFKYNPEKAKQLLSEAGYPKGFKTSIIVQTVTRDLDSVAIFKAMWAKVGIDLEILPREAAVYAAVNLARSYEELGFRNLQSFTAFGQRYLFQAYRGNQRTNGSYVGATSPGGYEPVIEVAFNEIQKNVIINYPKADEVVRDLVPYVLEQAYMIPRPTPYQYRLWQPWLKNYYGESSTKFWVAYPWIDQDLKEVMTGRK